MNEFYLGFLFGVIAVLGPFIVILSARGIERHD